MTADGALVISAADVRRERVGWLAPGRVPLGAVTLVAGDPGGKSLWACGLAAALSRGELPGGPASSLLVTAEDSLSVTLRPRLEAAGADLELVGFVQMWRDGFEDGIRLPDDIAELDRLAGEHDARLVVIDPLMAHLPSEVNSWRDQSVRLALAPLRVMAETRACAVVVVVHLNKGTSTDPLSRIGGSMGIPAAARSALLLARDPDDGDSGSRRVLAHTKCNLAALAPSVLCEIETIIVPAHGDRPEVEVPRIVEVGESGHSGPDLLARDSNASSGDQDSALEEAVVFLREELGNGPVEAKRMLAAARDAGISSMTLKRARKGRVSAKRRGGLGSAGSWWWRLEGQGDVNPLIAARVDPLNGNVEAEPDSAAPPAASEPMRIVSEIDPLSGAATLTNTEVLALAAEDGLDLTGWPEHELRPLIDRMRAAYSEAER
jgi:hypothetical protein